LAEFAIVKIVAPSSFTLPSNLIISSSLVKNHSQSPEHSYILYFIRFIRAGGMKAYPAKFMSLVAAIL
jgi:hypothetical protein